MKICSGHIATEVGDAEEQELNQYFQETEGMIRLQPGGWLFPKSYLKYEEKYYNFKFRPDDVLVMTYPKVGTTWTQEIVWTMRNNPNLDNPEASLGLYARSPFIDFDMTRPTEGPIAEELKKEGLYQEFLLTCPAGDIQHGVMLQIATALPHSRTLKTHLPFSLFRGAMLDTIKVVYVVRNPKDAMLSYQHHCKLISSHNFVGTQDVFVELFTKNKLWWGSYAEHLKEAWKHRQHPNLHWIFYEDMKADIGEELKKLDSFLGTGLTDQQLENVKLHTSFSAMQERDPTNVMSSVRVNREVATRDGAFIRKGAVGGWKAALTPHQNEVMDQWYKENLSNIGIQFTYQ